MSSSPEFKRPTRRYIKGPDQAARDEKIRELQKQIKDVDYRLNKVKTSISGSGVDEKTSNRRKELLNELNSIIKVQGDLKNQRNQINEKIKAIDGPLKKKLDDLKTQTSKSRFKTVEEIDSQIKKLDDAIASGQLKIVEERRNVKEITALRKLKKDFGQVEVSKKRIEEDKAKIGELKKQLAALNNKEIQTKFESITKELDDIKNSSKSVNDKRKSLFDQRNALQKEKDSYYNEIRKIRNEYQAAYEKFVSDVAKEKKRIQEEEEEFNKQQQKTLREKELKEELELASRPAFKEEISSIKVLTQYFSKLINKPVPDVIANESEKPLAGSLASLNLNGNGSKSTGRVVAVPLNYVAVKKPQESFFAGTKPKGKKNKKKSHSEDSDKFILEPDVIVQLSELGLLVPTSKDAVPKLIDSLVAKFETYKKDQDEVTKKNVEKAKAKIAALEKKYAAEDKESDVAEEENKEN